MRMRVAVFKRGGASTLAPHGRSKGHSKTTLGKARVHENDCGIEGAPVGAARRSQLGTVSRTHRALAFRCVRGNGTCAPRGRYLLHDGR